MRRMATASLAALLLAGCGYYHVPLSRPSVVRPQASEAPVQVLVKFKSVVRGPELRAFRAEFGTRSVGYLEGLDVYVEEVTSRRPVDEVLAAMNASPLVQYAEINGRVGIVQ